jgi:site-specific recombinase XerD
MTLLSDAIDAYFDENAALRDWSKRTVSSYRYRIQSFVRFLDDPEVDVSAVLTYDNTARYFNWLSQRGYKDTTLYAKKQAFCAFWDWCHQKELVDQALNVRLKKAEHPPVVYLTPDESAMLEKAALGGTCSRSILHLRDQAVFALLDEAELPLGALSDLTVDAYDPDAQTLSLGAVTILISEHLCELLDRYIQARSIYQEV